MRGEFIIMQKRKYYLFKPFLIVLFISIFMNLSINTVNASSFSRNLKRGMNGDDVRILQTSLKSMGFFDTEPTGYFGEITEVSVIKLQDSYGLSQDGIAGPNVFSVINKFIYGEADRSSTASRGEYDRADKHQRIVDTAKKYLGVSYVWGGASPSGFDSSGLIWYVYKQNGITLPRVSFDMYKEGTPVSKDELLPGDIVFFQGYAKGASHATIYAGNGNFIHSPSSGRTVSIDKLFENEYYWNPRFYGARRYINNN